MISIPVAVFILFFHFFADFICQKDYWAKNKSKYNNILFRHVMVYSVVISAGVSIVTTGLLCPFLFFLITFVCHFATDYVSSRLTSKLAKKEDWHTFFIVIGADQFLHAAQLLITFYYICGE